MQWHTPLAIINPMAGRIGSERAAVRALKTLCEQKGSMLTLRIVEHPHDARTWASRARTEGHDVVIVGGGDGTLNETVTGLRQGGELPIGILPTGSGNVLAHALGIPSGARAVAEFSQGTVRWIDLGYASSHDRYLVQGAAIGYGSKLFEDATQRFKNLLGYPAYVVAALRHVLFVRTAKFRCTFDGTTDEVATQILVIMNTDIPGLHLLMSGLPVRVDDGLLDVVSFRYSHTREMLQHMLQTARSPRRTDDLFTHRQTRNLAITTDDQVPITIDGEVLSGSTLTMTVLPKALPVVAPRFPVRRFRLPQWLFR